MSEVLVCPKCGTELKVDGLLATCHHCNRTFLTREMKKRG